MPKCLFPFCLTALILVGGSQDICVPALAWPQCAAVYFPAVPLSPHAHSRTDGTFGAAAGAGGILAKLPPEDRKNVVLLDGDGIVYASRPALARELQAPTKIGDNLYRSDEGQTFAAPAVSTPHATPGKADDLFGISKDRKTGPYHGVYTRPGFSYLEATIHLPGSSLMPPDVLVDPARHEDTPFVYLGGEGAHGGAVDAGFQYSPAHDDWSLFLSVEGFGYIGDTGTRFRSDQDVHLRFYVPADNYLTVAATGLDDNGDTISRTLVRDVSRFPTTGHAPAGRAGQPTGFGWSATGGGNVLKRLTSVAQRTQAFDTRTYTRDVRWSSVRVGTSPEHSHSWGQGDGAETFDWPDSQHILVRRQGPADETVSILLNR